MKRTFLVFSIFTLLSAATVAHPDDTPTLLGIPLDQPGNYEFHFRQPHRREMTLMLEVDLTEGEARRVALTHLRTAIEVSLTDHSGRRVCDARATPTEGMTEDHWVLQTSANEAAFWHFGCREIKLKRSERYTLKIRIRDVDPNTPKIRLTPTFQRSDDFWP